jgi:CheY-like chemotaxis protein
MVILDIKMPQMNGFKLYGEMRRLDNQVKVCFITAGEMYYDEVREKKGEEEKQYCKLDAEQFLQKPISNLDLVNTVNKILMPLHLSPYDERFGVHNDYHLENK